MPSINMVAARRAEKNRLEQRTRNLVYGILAETALFLVALSYMGLQVVSTQSQAVGLQSRIDKLKPQVDQIQALQTQTALLQPKLTALDTARTSTLYWYTAVQNLTDSLSSTSWLLNMNTTGDPTTVADPKAPGAATGPQMLISGISLSQADVGMTMLRMNQYPQFSHVDLDNLQRQNVPGAAPSASPTIGPCQFQMTLELSPISSGNSSGTTLGNDNVQKS